MKYFRIGFIYLIICLTTVTMVTAAPRDEIEKVQIHFLQGDWAAKSGLESRVTASVQAVSEKLLVGRKIADVEANKQRFEATIRQVFDRVLYGYELADIRIVPDQQTAIYLLIVPWGDTVQTVRVQIEAENISEEAQVLIRQDLEGIDRNIAQVLVGLPIDAFAWADSVSRAMIREMISERLPEFRADIDYAPARHSVVHIRLQPQGLTIKTTEVSLRSESMPKLLLLPIAGSAEAFAEKLNGLPVVFVQRHKKVYEERLQQVLGKNTIVKKYNLDTQTNYTFGEKTTVGVKAEANRYKINLEGVLDLGRNGNGNTMGRNHVGYFVKPNTELFLDTDFYPNTMSWHLHPGIGKQLTAKTYIGVKHDVKNNEDIGILRHKLSDDLWLNIERNATSGERLTAIRYRMHDFLSAEAISDHKKTWVRLIADL
jgi:hypothetical protein